MLSCMQCMRMAGSAFPSCTTLEMTRMGMRRLQSAGPLSTRCASLSAVACTLLSVQAQARLCELGQSALRHMALHLRYT